LVKKLVIDTVFRCHFLNPLSNSNLPRQYWKRRSITVESQHRYKQQNCTGSKTYLNLDFYNNSGQSLEPMYSLLQSLISQILAYAYA
jgi:hypothetical protein